MESSEVSPGALSALEHLSGSLLTAEGIIQISNKLRNLNSYEVLQQIMVDWEARIEAIETLSDREALNFLQQLFSSLDHAALYDHGVRANETVMRRDGTGNVQMQYPGTMPCWTIHLTTSGKGLLINNEMEAQVVRGDMMLFSPTATYHAGIYPAAEHWTHYWALFQPRPHWSSWLEWRELDAGILVSHLPNEENTASIQSLFDDLITLSRGPDPFQIDLQMNRLEEILIRVNAYRQAATSTQVDPRIETACRYMQANIADRWSIDDVAEACHLSTSRFAHLFKDQTGISPKSWSNSLRLQLARKLLLASDDSIGHIALQVGYDDPNQFTRYFKKSLGCSPKRFRQSFIET